VSSALGITVGGAVSPGFTQQEVRTAVQLESGQTYAIGGLIQNTVQASSSKVPVLGDLPFIGVGFSTVTHSQVETELVIMVTPRLVGPLNCDQVPKRLPGRETRNPDDYELFLENILEAPRGQRKVWNGKCYNAAYKCDPTAAIFPCVGGVCTGRGPGANCGAPAAPVRPGSVPPAVPATLPPVVPVTPGSPAPGGAAATLPAIPGLPLSAGGANADPVTGSNPAGSPVIVVPEIPQN
jgi:pilus assembly protein CpaC